MLTLCITSDSSFELFGLYFPDVGDERLSRFGDDGDAGNSNKEDGHHLGNSTVSSFPSKKVH